MEEFIKKEMIPLYRKHLYEAIWARRKSVDWVYSHMEGKYVEKYWHHIGLARIAYLTIKILRSEKTEA